jgi:hypothetical protein
MVSITQLLTYTSRVTVRIRNLPFLYTFEILCLPSLILQENHHPGFMSS